MCDKATEESSWIALVRSVCMQSTFWSMLKIWNLLTRLSCSYFDVNSENFTKKSTNRELSWCIRSYCCDLDQLNVLIVRNKNVFDENPNFFNQRKFFKTEINSHGMNSTDNIVFLLTWDYSYWNFKSASRPQNWI